MKRSYSRGPRETYSLFGDGSDGDATIAVNTSLATNKFYNNLTINAGVELRAQTRLICVKDTLTVRGTLTSYLGTSLKGNPGVGAVGGAAVSVASAMLPLSRNSAAGVNGGLAGGSNGNNVTHLRTWHSIPYSGGTGGAGGNSGATTGGTGGTLPSGVCVALRIGELLSPAVCVTAMNSIVPLEVCLAGASGGAGAGDGANNGGGSGSGALGGGQLRVQAKHIFVDTTGIIHSDGGIGGAGANGTGGNAAGGGGGGGGSGGLTDLLYYTLVNNGVIRSNGGLGGAKGLGVGTGTDGTDGTAGTSGFVRLTNLFTGTVTVV